MKEVPLSEVKDDRSRFLREAEKQEIVIARHAAQAEFSALIKNIPPEKR